MAVTRWAVALVSQIAPNPKRTSRGLSGTRIRASTPAESGSTITTRSAALAETQSSPLTGS